MIEEFIEGAIEVTAEILFSGDMIAKGLGWIGAGLAWVLSFGRSDWEADDWQALVTGGLTMMVVAGVGAGAWIHAATGG